MGTLRTLLAIGVVLAHCGTYGPAGGITAVEAFFAISGFYMSLIFEPKYAGAAAPFFFARFMRLYPAYLVVLTVALFYYSIAYVAGVPTFFSGMLAQSKPTLLALFATLNLSVLFSETLWFLSPDGMELRGLVLPPIWTLSLEVMFYLLCPVILRWRSVSIVMLALALIVARCIAFYFGFDTLHWGAMFFPFQLPYFLFGVLAHRAYAAGIGKSARVLPWLAFGIVVTFYGFVRLVRLPALYEQPDFWHAQILVAIVVFSLPSLFELSRASVLDQTIGELSYPLYVIHYVFVEIFAFKSISPGKVGLIVLSLSLAHAIALYWFIQRPVDSFRHSRASLAL
jgi:peptidoglycan/LPS O-acetylase OafA/YrhL